MQSLPKIAVCDNNIAVCGFIETTIEKYANFMQEQFCVKQYSSELELISELEHGEYFDIIFISTGLDNGRGFEVCRRIREEFHYPNSHIYFLHPGTEINRTFLRVQPMDVLPMPLHKQDILAALQKSISILGASGGAEEFFIYQSNHEYYKVLKGNIYYFSRVKNSEKIKIVTAHGTNEFYSSMKKVFDQLSGGGFLFIDRSIIVNILQIEHFKLEGVKLYHDDEILPISQLRYGELLAEWRKLSSKNFFINE
ncbi:MAG: LytTR family transcriptional regulator DNA-binding domain-containing protein [Lachnospiraceae bacterium]|jgi:DNA-binding LytR/AlgR family response regulator|nr:LytTR family transcriptional regulator DNA-binding domain-containing protein [Lachnospiraceae bacterium]